MFEPSSDADGDNSPTSAAIANNDAHTAQNDDWGYADYVSIFLNDDYDTPYALSMNIWRIYWRWILAVPSF